MTPRERRAFLVASLLLLGASATRYALESRPREPLLPTDSAGVGQELLDETRRARAETERRSRPLEEDERIDPNRAPAEELDRLPGVGAVTADRIVAEREEGGYFRSPSDLVRVRGIGPATARRMEPLLDFSTLPRVTFRPPPAPSVASSSSEPSVLDLNRATAEELQELRGIGPVLAERVVALRREKGRFRRVEDLLEVPGVGPVTLERLRPRLRVGVR